ncbi:hypothetical protein [Gracilimonas sp.]|uniref:hypothetical protein n=1 Tax=Gracilimonas sp. TaxID=1974203 RepID=UPI002870C996|nr:hypothetical protein [Gracilimonas sp.]
MENETTEILEENMNGTEAVSAVDAIVIGRFRIKLPFNFYLLRPHKSDRLFVGKRATKYMQKYPKDLNDDKELSAKKWGFEDGYIACLDDLGIKLTYPKDQ